MLVQLPSQCTETIYVRGGVGLFPLYIYAPKCVHLYLLVYARLIL